MFIQIKMNYIDSEFIFISINKFLLPNTGDLNCLTI